MSRCVEVRAIKAANSKNVAKFIYKDVICRHGCLQRVILDRRSENLNLTNELLEHYKIKRTVVSVERGVGYGCIVIGV